MTLPNKTSSCSICKKRGYTEWHHIISQHHAIRSGQEELLDNPDNLIELCKKCHDQTTASMVRKRLLKEGKRVTKQPSGRRRSARAMAKQVVEKTPANETKQQRRERLAAEAKRKQERMEKSITNLELRGVFWKESPYSHLKYLLNYLDKVSTEDELAEKWSTLLKTNPGISSLYPKDHWLHNSEIFDKETSTEFEKDGFCWTNNGGAWRKDVSSERANFEINLAKIRMNERNAIEKLQQVAAASEESIRIKQKLEKSILNLEERGVYYSESHVREFHQFFQYLKQVSIIDSLAEKWVERFEDSLNQSLSALYPKDHWMHNSEIFDKEMSSEFEKDGFCWTPLGGAWKMNLTRQQTDAEIILAKIRAEERLLISREEERLEIERERLEKEEHKQNSIESLSSRDVFSSYSQVRNSSNLISYFRGTRSESAISEKWSEYFNENSVNRLYPQDHWLHSEEEFDANMSKMFEDDGFCWTDEGGIWKQNLTLEQAKAEVNLAEVKANQRAILEREQARLDDLMKASH